MASSLVMGPFDVLDPASPVFLAPGFDRGAPAPTVSQILSTVLDGAAVTGRASGNRQITLPLVIRASGRLQGAAIANQILQMVDQRTWTLTFTPDGGLPVVYDCYRATATVTSDLTTDQQGFQSLMVVCQALPYGHSPYPVTVPLAGTAVQIEGFNANPIPVGTTAQTGSYVGNARVTTGFVLEGASSLRVDYGAGPVSLVLTSGTVSIPVTFVPSLVTISVLVPSAAALSSTGDWSLVMAVSGTAYTAGSIVNVLPGNGQWVKVSFDMSAIPVGSTITSWSLYTSTISATPAAGGAQSVAFAYTGAVSTWTVPTGITQIQVDVKGAGGGGSSTAGGSGGRVTGVVAVTPGQTIYVRLGGAGGAWGGVSAGGAGGFNGGGAGGTGGGSSGYGGAGGGGSSEIRVGADTVASQVVVAAGGGGSGRNGGTGGVGGATVGGSGSSLGSTGGVSGGGSQTAGGAGAVATVSGAPGSLSLGGRGGNGTSGPGYGGGGGGGGYYGGGGGGGTGSRSTVSSGGGGGSNYTSSAMVSSSSYQGGGSVGRANGTITFTWDTTATTLSMFFDDLRMSSGAPAGISDAYGGVYQLAPIIGTARTPINVSVVRAVGPANLGAWIVHTPPSSNPNAQPLIPLGGAASGVNYLAAPPVRYNGTYSVWLAGGVFSGTGPRTWQVQVNQSNPPGPIPFVSLVLTPTTNNQLVYLGEMTLPLTAYPPESASYTTFIVTSSIAADTFNSVLLLDTRGQSVIVSAGAPLSTNGWIDAPDPTRAFGDVWMGSARNSAASVSSYLLAASVLIQDPGSAQVMLYNSTGVIAGTVTYYPRWLQEAGQ